MNVITNKEQTNVLDASSTDAKWRKMIIIYTPPLECTPLVMHDVMYCVPSIQFCRNPSLGLATKAKRGYKVAGQEEARESHHILPGVQESVREWTFTLLRQLPPWKMDSQWTPKISKSDFRGQNAMACDVLYNIRKLLERKCPKWALIAHLDI